MIHITKDNFNEIISENEKVLIDFYATWCGPCKMIAPTIEALDKELSDVCVCKADVDEVTDLAIRFGIEYIPTIVYIKNGETQAKLTGLKSKEDILNILK